jgi:hypothetical protein
MIVGHIVVAFIEEDVVAIVRLPGLVSDRIHLGSSFIENIEPQKVRQSGYSVVNQMRPKI